MLTLCFTPFPVIETDRLILKCLDKTDAYDILALRSDNRINEHIDRKKILLIEEAEYFIYKIKSGVEKNELIYWVIRDKVTNKMLGTIGIWNVEPEASAAELGYELLFIEHGKGYMIEAVRAVIAYAFETMKLETIKAVVRITNLPSLKIMDKMRFSLDRKEDNELFFVLSSAE